MAIKKTRIEFIISKFKNREKLIATSPNNWMCVSKGQYIAPIKLQKGKQHEQLKIDPFLKYYTEYDAKQQHL